MMKFYLSYFFYKTNFEEELRREVVQVIVL